MIKLLGTTPRTLHVAVSGGVDSMVLFDFLRRKHTVTPVFVDHRTENSRAAYKFTVDYLTSLGYPVSVFVISGSKSASDSWEEHWRKERYRAFATLRGSVAVAHHLDDVAETWIWSCLHGTPSLQPYSHANVIRPLLLNRKSTLLEWAREKNVKWIEDASNNDTSHTRNYIRHELMPAALRVNPGLHSMLRKKLVARGAKMEDSTIDS